MSANETTQPALRMKIDLATGPNPPWTNVYFDCEKCPARYQLGAADECKELLRMEFESRKFETPPCWHCGHVNVIRTSVFVAEGNPS